MYNYIKNFFGVDSANAITLTCNATLQPLTPFVVTPFKRWTGFTEAATKNGGEIYYQLSNDAGLTWKYWNGSTWSAVVTPQNYNTAAEVNSHISSFTGVASSVAGSVLFKATLVSDCAHDIQLLTIAVDYDQPDIGHTLTAGNSAVSFADESGTPLTSATGTIYVNYLGTPAAKLTLSGNLDLTNQVVGSALNSSWLSLTEPALSSVSNVQLILPKTNSNASVRVCPGVLAAVNILPGCLNETILNSGQNSANGYSLVNASDPTHWYIKVSTTGTLALGTTEFVPKTSSQSAATSTCGIIFNAASSNPTALLNSTLPTSNYSLSGTVTFSTTGETDIIVRHQNDNNLWKVVFGNGTVQFKGLVNSVSAIANNANIANFVPTLGATYKFKVQVNGIQLRAKWWLATDAEVDQWMLYAADDRILSGGVGISPSGTSLVPSATFAGLNVSSCLVDEAIPSPAPIIPAPEPAVPSPSAPVVEISLLPTKSVSSLTAIATSNTVTQIAKTVTAALTASTVSSVPTTVTQTLAPVDNPAVSVVAVVNLTATSPTTTTVLAEAPGVVNITQNLNNTVTVTLGNTTTVAATPTITVPAVSESVAPATVTTTLTPKVTSALSVVAVVNPAPAPVTAPIVLVDSPGLASITQNPGGTLSVKVGDTTTVTVTTPLPLTTDQAHVVIASNNGTTVNLFVDGSIVASTPALKASVPTIIATTTATVTINNPVVVPTVDLLQQALTNTEVNNIVLAAHNQVPIVAITRASQKTDDGYVDINYRVLDAKSNYVSISQYEYSLTGEFTGEQRTMTLAMNDVDHDGIGTLATSPLGTNHTLVWNAHADLGNAYAPQVYIRLKVNDGIANGLPVKSLPFSVDVKAPILSNLVAEEQTDGSGIVKIKYRVADDTNVVTVGGPDDAFSIDNGLTWQPLITVLETSDLGVMTANGDNTKTISWRAGTDANNIDTSMALIRLSAKDSFGNKVVLTSAPFTLETKVPFGLANFAGRVDNTTQIEWGWSPVAAESHFNRYEIWYGLDGASVVGHSTTSAKLWSNKKNNDLGIMGTHTTIITGLTLSTTYYAEITAYDTFGNKITLPVAAYATLGNTTGGSGGGYRSLFEGGGGGGVSIIETVLPVTAITPPVKPKGGFVITINNQDVITDNQMVILGLKAGDDTITMALSNFADLHDAVQEPFSSSKQWHLCSEQGGLVTNINCVSGKHTVYVKFYTKFGESSKIISDSINLNAPTIGSGGGSSKAVPANGALAAGGTGQSQTRGGTASNVFIAAVANPLIDALSKIKESPILAKPQIGSIQQSSVANKIEFVGQGIPNAKVALFLHSDQVVVYTTDADAKGNWYFTHDQNETTLAPGEHTIYAVTYDPGSGIKSKPTPVKTFFVKQNRLALVLSYFDIWTTVLTLGIAVVVIAFLILRRSQKGLPT